jgi:chaperonin GroES
MVKKIRPLSDNILVKRFSNQSVTTGGIFVPETAQGKTQTGEVISIGEGKTLVDGKILSPKISVGDVVIFGKYAGTDVELNGEDFFLLKESDVLGIVENCISCVDKVSVEKQSQI